MTVATAWLPSEIRTLESSAESKAPAERVRKIGSLISALASIAKCETSETSPRMRSMMTSSLTARGVNDSRLKLAPSGNPAFATRELRSATTAEPSCKPRKRLRGVKRHASSRPVGVK